MRKRQLGRASLQELPPRSCRLCPSETTRPAAPGAAPQSASIRPFWRPFRNVSTGDDTFEDMAGNVPRISRTHRRQPRTELLAPSSGFRFVEPDLTRTSPAGQEIVRSFFEKARPAPPVPRSSRTKRWARVRPHADCRSLEPPMPRLGRPGDAAVPLDGGVKTTRRQQILRMTIGERVPAR